MQKYKYHSFLSHPFCGKDEDVYWCDPKIGPFCSNCCCLVTQSCPTLWDPMDCPSPSWSLLRLMSIESVMPSNHLILCHRLLLLPSIFPSIRVFSNELARGIGWPKYWSFIFSISPSSEYSGLISFRIYLLAFEKTLKNLLQHNLKKSVLWCSVFFTVQLSHLSVTTGKAIALAIQTFVGKVTSLWICLS